MPPSVPLLLGHQGPLRRSHERLEYWFYSDLDEPYRKDQRPFFQFDVREHRPQNLEELCWFASARFDMDKILAAAPPDAGAPESDVVTAEEEPEAYHIVKAIARIAPSPGEAGDPGRPTTGHSSAGVHRVLRSGARRRDPPERDVGVGVDDPAGGTLDPQSVVARRAGAGQVRAGSAPLDRRQACPAPKVLIRSDPRIRRVEAKGASCWPTSSRGCFAKSTAKSGTHLRLEEDALYPSLADVFEAAYIENPPVDHDRAIGAADVPVGKGDLRAADSRRAANLVRLPEERLRTVNAGTGGSLPFRRRAFPRRAPPQETAKWPGPGKDSS